jgi:glutathione peroxidase
MKTYLKNLFASNKRSSPLRPFPPKTIYEFSLRDIVGVETPLSKFSGKVLMIVNVASQCGNTPQYAGLERLYELYREKGFEVLGFPSNDFGAQEPGTNSEIREFCSSSYGVQFPLFSKINVKGTDPHPLYRYLTTETIVAGSVRWNFQKYLVDRKGNVVDRFAPTTLPLSNELVARIEKLL